jgi:hypothetical protein
MAAALALVSKFFRSSDPVYAAGCLADAKTAYAFASMYTAPARGSAGLGDINGGCQGACSTVRASCLSQHARRGCFSMYVRLQAGAAQYMGACLSCSQQNTLHCSPCQNTPGNGILNRSCCRGAEVLCCSGPVSKKLSTHCMRRAVLILLCSSTARSLICFTPLRTCEGMDSALGPNSLAPWQVHHVIQPQLVA